MRPLLEPTSRLSSNMFSRKYISLGRIISQWEDIVGSRMSDKAQPVRIQYRKQKNMKRGKPDARLDIAVNSADATVMHYQKDVILERINQLFGEQWITSIKFVTINTQSQNIPDSKKTLKPLCALQKKNLSELLNDIEDEDMKGRLISLGTEIMRSAPE